MIDALAMALAAVAMGIPAVITAAALGSKLGSALVARTSSLPIGPDTDVVDIDGIQNRRPGTFSAKG